MGFHDMIFFFLFEFNFFHVDFGILDFLAPLGSKLQALRVLLFTLFWAKKCWEGFIFPELQVVGAYKKKLLLLCLLECINALRKCNPSTYLIGSSSFCGLNWLV